MTVFFKNLQLLKNYIPILTYQNFSKSEYILISLPKDLIVCLSFLKKHIGFQYNLLSCVTGVDYLKKSYRFGVIYDLLSLNFNSRLRFKIYIDDFNFAFSTVSLFINANWWEREIWDLYGVYFENHPDLRRILTDYGFEGHPLRKDFPLSGFRELRYDQNQKLLVSEPVYLSQEYRYFNYKMPW